jgi:hypothetical protein
MPLKKGGKTGSGDRTRTCNNSINSRVRYQLRHTGIEFKYRIKTLKFNRFASYCQVDFPPPAGRGADWQYGFSADKLLLGLICLCGEQLAHFHSPFQRFQQGHRVGIFNVRAYRQASGNASDLDLRERF